MNTYHSNAVKPDNHIDWKWKGSRQGQSTSQQEMLWTMIVSVVSTFHDGYHMHAAIHPQDDSHSRSLQPHHVQML